MSLVSKTSSIYAKGVIGNVRKAQEDSHGYKLGTPNGDLFVVCDGMGGHVGGAMASKIAVDSIISYIESEKYAKPIDALNGALQFANMQILGYAANNPEYKGMGTTACIVLIQDRGVWIAHVGDSRIYLYLGKERQLHRITKDHSFVQTLVDAGQITDEEAEHHPNKNRIMKALGIKPELHPTFNYNERPILPKNGDIFLICSDGLSGMIPDKTIERVLGEKLTLDLRGDKLIELAMQGETVQPGGQDNCTLELIQIDQSYYKKTFFKSYNPDQSGSHQHPSGHTLNRKTLIIIVTAVIGAALILGGALWLLNPNRYDRQLEKAHLTIVAAQEKLNRAKKELDDAQKNLNGAKAEEAKKSYKELIRKKYNPDTEQAKEELNRAVKDSIRIQQKKDRLSKVRHKTSPSETNKTKK